MTRKGGATRKGWDKRSKKDRNQKNRVRKNTVRKNTVRKSRSRSENDKMSEENKTKRKNYSVLSVVKRMLKNMWEQDRSQYVRIALYTVLGAAYPFMAVVLPKIAIGVLEQGGENVEGRLVGTMAVYFLVAGGLAVATGYLTHYMRTRNMRIRLRYLNDLSEKLQTMDYCYHENAKFFEEYQKGMEAGNGDSHGIEGLYNKLSLLPASFLTLVAMMLLAGALSPVLLLSVVAHVAVIMWTAKLTHDYKYSKKEELSRASRKIGYYRKTTQDFSYGKDIRIFNLRDRIMDNYQQEINAHLKLIVKIKNREYLLGLVGIVTLLLTNLLTYGTLIQRVLQGMPVSSFTMYTSMVVSLMAQMLAFGKDLAFIRSEGEYVNDFYRLMDEPLTLEGEKTRADIVGKAAPEIVFEHVTFRYPGTKKNIFTDLNFKIRSGERLAIVGINGAGKSTLVKLMTGLFAPTEGRILADGTDISTLKKSELYGLYSAVFQDINILAFTIGENVACTSEYVNEKKVKEALEKVGLWEKVSGFENGMQQMMLKIIDENGTDFSGGERQKLAIARALYKDAAVVIMDEPTASLDALAEAEIYENFSALVENKTAIYISHRLASTRFCDKIALFDENGLTEYGNHDELMEKKGRYYDMFVIQGKYYQEEAAV